MYKLGRVLYVSSSGKLIIKGETKPNLGDRVINGKGRTIGTIFDVFGPTSSPYISVNLRIEKPHRLINRNLYAIHHKRRRRRR